MMYQSPKKERMPRLSPSDLSPREANGERTGGGLLTFPLSNPFLPDEDSLFAYFRDLGEQNAASPITLLLEDCLSPDEHALRRTVRALFRGAVYGNFSLLFGSVLTDETASRVWQTVHECFCDLESAGREFNGYLPKGILIHTPLGLRHPLAHTGADFFCLDLTALLRLETGLGARELCEYSSLLSEAMKGIDGFCEWADRKSIPVSAWITEPLTVAPVLSHLLCLPIKELFLPRKQIEEVKNVWEGSPFSEKERTP